MQPLSQFISRQYHSSEAFAKQNKTFACYNFKPDRFRLVPAKQAVKKENGKLSQAYCRRNIHVNVKGNAIRRSIQLLYVFHADEKNGV